MSGPNSEFRAFLDTKEIQGWNKAKKSENILPPRLDSFLIKVKG